MGQSLALIHTSQVFLNVETMMKSMFAEVMPDVRLINIMDDSLLPDVMVANEITEKVVRRMCFYVSGAEASGADAVLSLCSSLGPAIDVARKSAKIPVVKIDDAHTAKAVLEGRHIGIIATVPTTLSPTRELILEKAKKANRNVSVHEAFVAGAFEALVRGEKVKHDSMVLEAARRLVPKVDIILFAQASMTRLGEAVQRETALPVLTSPRLAIEYTKRILEGLVSSK